MPDPRADAVTARKTIHPWSWAARATATPSTPSPRTAMTAWSFSHEASTSASA